jgi:hypothetical protein
MTVPEITAHERPILFSGPMVSALLARTKTQTRRVVKHKWPYLWQEPYYPTGRVLTDLVNQPGAFMEFRTRMQDEPGYHGSTASTLVDCPFGRPGDRLWVRETYAPVTVGYAYAADPIWNPASRPPWKWRPSIHMPRAACRLVLEITDVRVERLGDISEADALAEGIVPTYGGFGLPGGEHYHAADPRQSFLSLWEAVYGEGSGMANPWVWAVTFKRL